MNSRLEELRAKYRPRIPDDYEMYDLKRRANCMPLEVALIPYLEELKDATKQQLMTGGHACGCMGPRDNEPYCPCSMWSHAKEIMLDKWYAENKK